LANDSAAAELAGLILRLDAQGVVLDCSAAAAGSPKPAAEALLGRRLDEVMPVEIADAAMPTLAAALECGTAQEVGYDATVSDRGLRRLLARFAPTLAGECLVVIADVTETERTVELGAANRRLADEVEERRRIEHALRRSEARARRAEDRLRQAGLLQRSLISLGFLS
jgi:hypothetical protein